MIIQNMVSQLLQPLYFAKMNLITLKFLDQHMRSRLAGYKVPRMYVPVTHMPLNSTQKPDKLAIRQMMNDKVSQTL